MPRIHIDKNEILEVFDNDVQVGHVIPIDNGFEWYGAKGKGFTEKYGVAVDLANDAADASTPDDYTYQIVTDAA